MSVLRFRVPGPPAAKARHRTRVVSPKGGGRAFAVQYADTATKREEARIAAFCREAMSEQGIEKTTGAVALFVLAVFKLPPSLSHAERMRRVWHTQKPDDDNCRKIVADALNGIAWEDDCAIVYGPPFKVWSASEEGYEVWVAPLPPEWRNVHEAFAALKRLSARFIERAEVITLTERFEDDGETMGLPGIGGPG